MFLIQIDLEQNQIIFRLTISNSRSPNDYFCNHYWFLTHSFKFNRYSLFKLNHLLSNKKVLENKEQVENLIKKYIRAIRLDYADETLKKKMIRKLCELRVRQCEILEESEIQTVSGHQFKLDSNSGCCDICMKKQGNLYIPLLNNLSNGQQLNVCTYCGYSIHVECQSEVK